MDEEIHGHVHPRHKNPIAIAALAALALMTLSNASRAESRSCVLGLEDPPQGQGIVLLSGSMSEGEIGVSCRAGAVASLTATLSPGSAVEARLHWSGEEDASVQIATHDGRAAPWLSAEIEARQGPGRILSLNFSAPDDAFAGRFESVDLRLGDQVLRVNLEITAGDGLFRDGFDVDPVIGQFSMVQ